MTSTVLVTALTTAMAASAIALEKIIIKFMTIFNLITEMTKPMKSLPIYPQQFFRPQY